MFYYKAQAENRIDMRLSGSRKSGRVLSNREKNILFYYRQRGVHMELTIGEVLEGKVTGIAKFGAFVALEGGKSGLVHISEVANTYVSDVNEFLKVGQIVKVKVIGISDEGRINLSIKRTLEPPKPENPPRNRDAQPKRDRPARAPMPQAASTSGDMDFEDRLKKFMQESDSRIADNRMYSEHRQRTRRK